MWWLLLTGSNFALTGDEGSRIRSSLLEELLELLSKVSSFEFGLCWSAKGSSSRGVKLDEFKRWECWRLSRPWAKFDMALGPRFDIDKDRLLVLMRGDEDLEIIGDVDGLRE